MPNNIQTFLEPIILQSVKIQGFSQNEIIELLPANVLNSIKSIDPHPFFQMYSLCHDGVSKPTLLGEDAEPITWTRKAIQSIKNIVTKGIKLFYKHNEDNSTDGRKELGEVVHSFEKEIDGKLHHVFISYHTPQQKEEAKKYDICSQEAVWNFFRDGKKLVADTIDKLTAIALESSRTEKPAFSGAKRLGLVQAFESQINNNIEGDSIMPDDGTNVTGGEPIVPRQQNNSNNKQLSFQEWARMKELFNVHPHQLFSEDELKHDRKFGQYFDELDTLRETKKTLEEQMKAKEDALSGQIKDLTKRIYLGSAKERMEKIAQNKALTDRMKEFVNKSFDDEKESLEDLSDEGLESFIDSRTNMFQKVLSTIDFQLPENTQTGDEENEKEKDPTKAEDNPFLDEDVEIDSVDYEGE